MVKGRLTLSVEGMDGKGDCMNCPISVWFPGDEDAGGYYGCPVVSSLEWWEKCPMEFVEVEE